MARPDLRWIKGEPGNRGLGRGRAALRTRRTIAGRDLPGMSKPAPRGNRPPTGVEPAPEQPSA